MVQYVWVNENNNKIRIGPVNLPNAWVNPDTAISYSLSTMTNQELLAINWKPYNVSGPTELGEFDSHIATTIEFTETTVEATNSTVLLSLEDTIEIKKKAIDSYRDSRVDGGVLYGGILFDSDELAQRNVTGAVTSVKIRMDMGIPVDPIPWTAYENIIVPLEALEVIDFGLKMAEYVSVCYQTGRVHKNNVMAMTDVNNVISYDHTSGWATNDLGGTIAALST